MAGNDPLAPPGLAQDDIAAGSKRVIAPTLDAKLAFLRQPSHYPEPTRRIEAVETHMSWVFLTDRYAYQLKKPVCHEEMDFRLL